MFKKLSSNQKAGKVTEETAKQIEKLIAESKKIKAEIVRLTANDSGHEFSLVQCADQLETDSPYWNAFPAYWDHVAGEVATWDGEILLRTPDGEELTEDKVYVAVRQGDHENGKPIYITTIGEPGAPGSGSTVNVKEEDGSPSYTGISTIAVDQDQGFVLTQPVTGTALVSIQDASDTQAGIVSVEVFGDEQKLGYGPKAIDKLRVNYGNDGGTPYVFQIDPYLGSQTAEESAPIFRVQSVSSGHNAAVLIGENYSWYGQWSSLNCYGPGAFLESLIVGHYTDPGEGSFTDSGTSISLNASFTYPAIQFRAGGEAPTSFDAVGDVYTDPGGNQSGRFRLTANFASPGTVANPCFSIDSGFNSEGGGYINSTHDGITVQGIIPGAEVNGGIVTNQGTPGEAGTVLTSDGSGIQWTGPGVSDTFSVVTGVDFGEMTTTTKTLTFTNGILTGVA